MSEITLDFLANLMQRQFDESLAFRAEVADQFAKVNLRIDRLEQRIDGLSARIRTQDERIDGLAARIDVLAARIINGLAP